MTWLIDVGADVNNPEYISLSTLAFNVTNRSAGWTVPAKRGDNLVVPGRNGAQWVPNKAFEVGRITLSMWAVGALEDGSMPSHGDLRRQARDNLDKLTALFAQTHRLLNIVQVSSLAFGVQNSVLNPGFESSTLSSSSSYTNRFYNPSMRRRATTAQTSNLMRNPNLVALKSPTWQPFWHNLVPDPTNKLNRAAASEFMTSNYWNSASFEDQPAGQEIHPNLWTSPSNVDATVQNNTAADRTANPAGGTKVLRLQSNAALGVNASLGSRNSFFFSADRVPLVRFRYRRSQNTTTARSIQVRIVTTTDAGAAVLTGGWQNFDLPSGLTAWADAAYVTVSSFTVTGTASRVRVDFRTGQAWNSGDGVIIDQASVTVQGSTGHSTTGYFANVAGPFFEGDSPWGGTSYVSAASWTTGLSRWSTNPDSRWVAVDPVDENGAYYATTDRPSTDLTGTALSFIAFGFKTGGTQVFYHEILSPTPGLPYSLRFLARGLTGTTTRVELARQRSNESSPTGLGNVVTVSGSGSGTASGSRLTGTTGSYTGGVYIPSSGDRLFVKVTTPVVTTGHPVFQFIRLDVTDAPSIFSGDTANSDHTQYIWQGAPYVSRSVALRRIPLRIENQTALFDTLDFLGAEKDVDTAEVSTKYDGQTTEIVLDPVSFSPTSGAYFSSAVYGRMYSDGIALGAPQPIARVSIRFLDSAGSLLSTYQGDSATLNATSGNDAVELTRLTAAAQPQNIPSGTTQMQCVIDLINPTRGHCLRAGRFMILPQGLSPTDFGAPVYFDGSTGGTWAGTANDSVSNYNIQFPTSWTFLNGVPIADTSAVAAKSIPRNSNPSVTLVSPLNSSHVAGTYALGIEVTAQGVSSTGVVDASILTDVVVQLVQSNVVVATIPFGTITGSPTKSILQGAVVANNPFSEVRLVFTAQTAGYSLVARCFRAFLSSLTTTNPQQRLGVNKIVNPNFYLTGGSTGDLIGWTAAGSYTKIITPKKNGVALAAGGSLTSTRFNVNPGENLRVAIWGRKNLQAVIRYFNTAGDPIGTENLPLVTQPEFVSPMETMIQVPPNVTRADIRISSPAGVVNAEAAYIYVASNFTMHNDTGEYDPWVFQYFDGSSTTDAFGLPTSWGSTADNSPSNVLPSLVNSWLPTAAPHRITNPRLVPSGSTGAVGGLSRILRGTSRVVRSGAVRTAPGDFVSGQISIASEPGTTVMVEVVSANAAEDNGDPIFSQITTSQREVVVWYDLIVPDNFCFVRVTYTESVNSSGYRVWMDNLALFVTKDSLNDDYPGYFDGDVGGSWLGAANNSVSQYYGGGRRAYAEVKDAIDMTSMAGGTRAEFVVDMEIPGAFWEDLTKSTSTMSVTSAELLASTTDPRGNVTKGTAFDLDSHAGGTAPIDDAVITVNVFGSVTGLKITDVATGGWIKITGSAPSKIVIDNGNFTVRDATNNSIISRVTRGGSNQLLPVVPLIAVVANTKIRPPRFRFEAESGTGSISVSVTANKRYVAA